jgi:hypothetical protein
VKNLKKYAGVGIIAVFILAAGSIAAFAASPYSTPAEVVAAIAGREVQSVINERIETGKTYGTIADEAGAFEEFKKKMLEAKRESIAARVADGTMTQEQADAILERMEVNQANCKGNGIGGGAGCRMGAGFGKARAFGGRRMGNGNGLRARQGATK